MKDPKSEDKTERLDGLSYIRAVADAGGRGRSSTSEFVRHPIRTLRMYRALGGVPLLEPDLSVGQAADAIRDAVAIGSWPRRFLLRGVTYVLPIGSSYDEFMKGSSRKLMRNSASNAARRGVRWELVEDGEVRRALLAEADEFERNHPQAQYRGDAPDNSELLQVPIWVVVRSADGEPLVLAMVVADGEWGLLRYSRLMQDSETASFSRYYMITVLAQLMIDRGVRYLVAHGSPLRVGPGLYYFMQRIGFDAYRVRPRDSSTHRSPAGASGIRTP